MKFQCQACQGLVQIDFDDPMVNCGICNAICEVPGPFGPTVVIDDFMIIKLLGEGGMGNVYLAHQFSLDREVALKILKDTIADNEQFRNEFIKEARSVASLNHPNIIQAYKVGIDDDILFFAMEYVEGQTLQDLLKQDGALMEMQVLSFAQEIAVALGYAWEKRQLVHRDIKPENIMLANDGQTKLMDLGLSCHAGDDDGNDDKISGTPQYISPEQILGDAIDIRTDFYCLGASLYHLLSGGFPFEGNLREMVQKHLKEPPPNLKKRRPDLNTATVKLVHKLMNKDPDDRFPSSQALLNELGNCKKLLLDDKKGKKHFSYNKTKHGTRSLSKSKVLNESASTSRNKAKSSARPVPKLNTDTCKNSKIKLNTDTCKNSKIKLNTDTSKISKIKSEPGSTSKNKVKTDHALKSKKKVKTGSGRPGKRKTPSDAGSSRKNRRPGPGKSGRNKSQKRKGKSSQTLVIVLVVIALCIIVAVIALSGSKEKPAAKNIGQKPNPPIATL